VPTTAGTLYFKATTAAFGYEPALTAALARWRPDCMPQVLAAAPEQGWLLLRDAGVTLRSLIQHEQRADRWFDLLPLYASVQIDLSARLTDLLALGVPDRRLTLLPTLYEQLLDEQTALLIGQPDGLTADDYARLRRWIPQVQALCTELAQYNIPMTLHHDDFHDANIFIQGDRVTFADWAESCVAHPFFSLVVMLRSTAYQLKLSEEAPELTQLRDAYLEPFTRYETPKNLVAASKVAHRLGMLCRALTWHQVVSALAEPTKTEYAAAVPGWLQEFLGGRVTAAL
jgi:aminoglycoside/choline kinase family phosphotransferase